VAGVDEAPRGRVSFAGAGRSGDSGAVRGELTQQHGYFHAGVTGAIADSACGYAAYTLMAAEDSVLTVEYKINLLAPADGEELEARARAVRSGKTLKDLHGGRVCEKGRGGESLRDGACDDCVYGGEGGSAAGISA
jgi:uncharacterized protein (TIGR00369 family)